MRWLYDKQLELSIRPGYSSLDIDETFHGVCESFTYADASTCITKMLLNKDNLFNFKAYVSNFC